MRHKAASVSTAKPDAGSLELTEELIRVRISFTRNGAVKTGTTSMIGCKRKPKYLERNSLLRLKQTIGKREQGGGSVKAAVALLRRFHQGHPFSRQDPGRERCSFAANRALR
jgi:hypothetical protein